jgi:hypothetical protein
MLVPLVDIKPLAHATLCVRAELPVKKRAVDATNRSNRVSLKVSKLHVNHTKI